MKYVAVMFDVIESRKYYDRYDVQKILMESVNYLNDLYNCKIKKRVVSSAGDEFQGLFMDLQSAYIYIRKLQMVIYPIKVRCGVGYGEIKYDVEEWDSPAIDGEAYYLAREAITSLGRKKSNMMCFNTKTPYDKYLNILCLSNEQVKSWQSQVAHLIELVADIMLPIVNIKEDFSFYEFIMEKRNRLINQEQWNKTGGRYRNAEILNIDFAYLSEAAGKYVCRKEKEQTFYVEEYWAFGMSTDIARIMGTTRQNIDRYISLGRIKESRTMDKAIFDLLGEKLWKNI